jgi:hypothetical protein
MKDEIPAPKKIENANQNVNTSKAKRSFSDGGTNIPNPYFR